jgi:hypothetical protein
LFFWNDFIGSIKGGSYYSQLLTRSIGRAWLYMLILIAAGSVILAIPRVFAFNSFYTQTAQFLSENFDSLRFADGVIVNMPHNHLEKEFDHWIIAMDTAYTDSLAIKSIAPDSIGRKPTVYVGPKAAFIIIGASPLTFEYPAAFNQTISGDGLRRSRLVLNLISILIIFATFFVFKFIGGLFYALLIGLIIVFKFRSIGLSYTHGFHLGLYLMTFQFTISLMLDLAGVNLPYSFLWFIVMYILYIGLMININLDKSRLNQPESGSRHFDG